MCRVTEDNDTFHDDIDNDYDNIGDDYENLISQHSYMRRYFYQ